VEKIPPEYFLIDEVQRSLLGTKLVNNILLVGKFTGFVLGINFLTVFKNFENASTTGYHHKFINILFELQKYLFRQTDGFVLVTSSGTVN